MDYLTVSQLLNRTTVLLLRGKVSVCWFITSTCGCYLYSVTDSVSDAGSHVLKFATVIYLNELVVIISCEFKEGIERASCVLVYREYGNKTLVVKEYPQNTVFPVTLTVDGDPENYTFAIFGKRGSDIDERPIVEGRVSIIRTTLSSPQSGMYVWSGAWR